MSLGSRTNCCSVKLHINGKLEKVIVTESNGLITDLILTSLYPIDNSYTNKKLEKQNTCKFNLMYYNHFNLN